MAEENKVIEKNECCGEPDCSHKSDCAVHNAPAETPGECTCKSTKVEQAKEAIKKIFDDVKSINMLSLADKSKVFNVDDLGNIDEPFAFSIYDCDAYEEGEGNVELDISEDNWPDKLKEVYDNKIRKLCIDLAIDTTEKAFNAIRRLMLEQEAGLIVKIHQGLSDTRINDIEEAIRKLSESIDGFVYNTWEECELQFSIDGVQYSIYPFCDFEVATNEVTPTPV